MSLFVGIATEGLHVNPQTSFMSRMTFQDVTVKDYGSDHSVLVWPAP